MIRLEKRPTPSKFWQIATPIVAVVLTMIAGGIMFAILGKNPVEAIRTIFWDPLFDLLEHTVREKLTPDWLPQTWGVARTVEDILPIAEDMAARLSLDDGDVAAKA